MAWPAARWDPSGSTLPSSHRTGHLKPGTQGYEGITFAATDSLAVEIPSLAEVAVQFCVQEKRGGGKVTFNMTVDAASGVDKASLRTFEKGSYVTRVMVGSTLVKILPFVID